MPALDKRDNMGYAVPPALIVFLCMMGAAALVCCGFAVTKLMGGSDSDAWKARTVAQDDYMREVRARNVEGLMAEGHRAAYSKGYSKGPSPDQSRESAIE